MEKYTYFCLCDPTPTESPVREHLGRLANAFMETTSRAKNQHVATADLHASCLLSLHVNQIQLDRGLWALPCLALARPHPRRPMSYLLCLLEMSGNKITPAAAAESM